MKIFTFAFLLILSAAASLAQQPPITCEKGLYPPDKSTIPPTFEVDLDQPPERRWNKVNLAYKDQINGLLVYIKTFLLEVSPKLQELINIIDDETKLPEIMPQPYGDEMRGIAADVGAKIGDIVFYNIFYEIFTMCTSIVAQDPTGKMLHARNMDFGLFTGWDTKNDTWIITEMLRPVMMKVDFLRGGKVAYSSVSFAGFVGLITAFKANKYSVSLNDRFMVNGGYVGLFEYIMGINRNQQFVTLMVRDVFDNEDMHFDDVVKTLASTPLLAPCYYIVSGPEPKQGAVVTRDRKGAADIWHLGVNSTWFIAETNYDHWKNPLIVDDRITPTNTCMNRTTQRNIDFATLFDVLSTKPVLNKLTVYTVLMSTTTGEFELYLQNCKSPCDPW